MNNSPHWAGNFVRNSSVKAALAIERNRVSELFKEKGCGVFLKDIGGIKTKTEKTPRTKWFQGLADFSPSFEAGVVFI